jgi:enoyl-CoA hydratase/carnithine racemase
MSVPEILSDRQGAVLTLTLNRPDQINAVNDAIREGLPKAMEAADRDPAVAVIVLAGAGLRGFCVGADIKETRAPETPVEARARLGGNAWIERVAATRKPVVVALHGFCLGAGLELAMAADLRIAAADARLGLPEVALGLIPGGGGTQRLPRLVGEARALDMILTGERLDAEAALAAGLVTRLAPDAETALATARKIAAQMAAKPPAALRHAKEATRAALAMPLAQGLATERALFALLLDTEDRKEAARAFREKRPPNFNGR